MQVFEVVLVLVGYFLMLIVVSRYTSRRANLEAFFNANRRSPWYVVAYGMIGASLSGVTFISVPGWVRDSQFSYFQMVIGYILGYLAIATILLPVYYRYGLVSIYKFLDYRIGRYGYRTGSFFFLLSRFVGASLRLFLVATVLHMAIFEPLGVKFWITVVVTLILILIYTHKAGIKTIVWTDLFQTTFMLLAVVATIVIIGKQMNLGLLDLVQVIKQSDYSQTFFWDWRDSKYFWKMFFSGAFMAYVMTGLDQDMMQKNLTVRTLRQSQKNMIIFSLSLLPVNLLFLSLGALMYIYADRFGIILPKMSDQVYPYLALNYFGFWAAMFFIIGLIAAAFSSADSAITALTTAILIDFFNFDVKRDDKKAKLFKSLMHSFVAFVIFVIIMIFNEINDKSVIEQLFRYSSYLYGPLLGLFSYALLFKDRKIESWLVVVISVASPFLTHLFKVYIERFTDYKFSFELLIVNGLITFVGLILVYKVKSAFKHLG